MVVAILGQDFKAFVIAIRIFSQPVFAFPVLSEYSDLCYT